MADFKKNDNSNFFEAPSRKVYRVRDFYKLVDDSLGKISIQRIEAHGGKKKWAFVVLFSVTYTKGTMKGEVTYRSAVVREFEDGSGLFCSSNMISI